MTSWTNSSRRSSTPQPASEKNKLGVQFRIFPSFPPDTLHLTLTSIVFLQPTFVITGHESFGNFSNWGEIDWFVQHIEMGQCGYRHQVAISLSLKIFTQFIFLINFLIKYWNICLDRNDRVVLNFSVAVIDLLAVYSWKRRKMKYVQIH